MGSPDVDLILATRHRRRVRGAIEIGVGLALIVAGIIITLLTYNKTAKSGGMYVLAYGPVVLGFFGIVRGTIRMLRSEHGLMMPSVKHGTRYDLTIGVGFKSFVAWRYLMARHHRVSRAVLFVFFLGLFITVVSTTIQLTLATKANPLKLDPLQMQNFARYVSAGLALGLVLLYFTALIGALRFIFSFFTTVPLVGVWIGTGALVCVLSVMSGFESDLRQKILGSNAHIQVTAEEGEMKDWREIKKKIDAVPGVIASTPYAVSEVVIASNSNGMNVIIKGIDPETVGSVTKLVSSIQDPDKAAVMKRLDPIVDDNYNLEVPGTGSGAGSGSGSGSAGAGSGVLDPPPDDMPGTGDPIDFSQPDPALRGWDEPPALDDIDHPPPPLDGSNAIAKGSDQQPPMPELVPGPHIATPVVDPPPDDLVTSEEPPTDYSGREDEDDDTIHVVDVPLDQQPSLSRRTQSLPGILVGKELVKQTHLYTGEEVRVVSPLSDPSNPDATGTPIPFNRDYRVAGEFFTGMYEYDLKYVYVTLDSLQDFLDRGDAVDGIEVRIGSPDDTDAYVAKLQRTLGKEYRIQDWKELNRSLFSALKLEKIAMFLVLGIVILVASFSIVGNLIMVVVEKGREIALLKTLGASDASLMLVFAIQGVLIGLIGTALGVGTGLLACYLGKTFGIPLNPDVYYIDKMPVHVDPQSVLITAFAGVMISMAATFYPAFVAARVRPAAGMRH
ncbi:MAG TPA: FtsX-like permease family protein [Kofleriaceae bacterium]|nr:FtsX-like permease family protein [Kofleriaceae bacterium]